MGQQVEFMIFRTLYADGGAIDILPSSPLDDIINFRFANTLFMF